MSYFLIKQYSSTHNAIDVNVSFLERKRIWNEEKPLFVPIENGKEKIYLPFMDCGVCVISEKVKKIFETYQNGIVTRPIVLANMQSKTTEIFYCIKTKELDCLGGNTVYGNGTVEEICLDTKKIGYEKVFQIKNIPYRHIVVDLEVLEKLMRENIIGYDAVLLKTEGSEEIWERNML